MATSSDANVIKLKLLIDARTKRLVFAEAGKDFVDFLFHLLHLPVGTVVSLLKEETMLGTLGNLHESVQNLKETYFQSNQTKDSLLKPRVPFSALQVPLLSLDGGAFVNNYTCQACITGVGASQIKEKKLYFSDNPHARCHCCWSDSSMSKIIYYDAGVNRPAEAGERGYMKGSVTYMVMDDLEVTPMSTSSCINMLKKFNVLEEGALEERVVDFGKPEGLKLLKASFHSNKVLTSVFLGKMVD